VKNRSLQIQKPDGSTDVITIEKPVFRIGRAEGNDLTIPEASVSRSHAVINIEPNGPAMLSDLNSANGTLVNGAAIEAPTPLSPNDSISIGSFRMIFRDEAPDTPFVIQSSGIELERLQQDPQLLLSGEDHTETGTGSSGGIEILYELGMTLARSHSIADVSGAAVDLLFKIENVHRATLLMWNEERGDFENAPILYRGGKKDDSHAPVVHDPRTRVLSRTILNRVRDENRPLLIRDARAEAALRSAESVFFSGIQAAFCSPLSCQGKFLGVLYADNLGRPDAFSETDFRVFTAIAAQTGLALGNAIASKELVRREVQRQALKVYLPPQVAELILSSDGAIDLSGTLQEISVLFADIRGFTRMSESMDARELVRMLNELFTVMSDVIFRAGGTVDKFIGDCVMALFGAPIPSEFSADQALSAAVLMQKAAQQMNEKRAAEGLRQTEIGIGLHTGLAVVGNIGSQDRVQYTAIGDTVNVASRLVDKAEPNQIIVSEELRRVLTNSEKLDFIGEVDLKGRQHKLGIYSARWPEIAADMERNAEDGALQNV
jgi:adenylate cyclase